MYGTVLFLIYLLPTALLVEFECPGNTNCSCSNGVHGDYELLCPNGLQRTKLFAQVLPRKYAQIQCTETNNWEEIRLLAGLKIGPVDSFILRLCPLPGISLREVMESVGITKVDGLQMNTLGNLSNTLTTKHLENLQEITRLNLNTNGLTELPVDIFKSVYNITWLDLKNNNLNLPKGIFSNVPKLEVLELGSNNISYLEPGIFKNLTKLRLLNLWGNKLKNLSRALFFEIPNLENLDLNSNGLNSLPPDIFADLIKLKNINLSSNNFTSLPQGLFLMNTNLEKIQIQSNYRNLSTLPTGLFANLTKLHTIILKSCNITNLPEDMFAGTTSLINLFLQWNSLQTLPSNIFKDNRKLENVNLGFNKISYLPDELFHSTTQLKILHMNNNFLTNLTEYIFSSLNNLEDLNLSNNLLEFIDPQAFSKTVALKTINLSNNRIQNFQSEYETVFGQHSFLVSSPNLEAVYLSHNNLSELYTDWIITMTHLQMLDLSYNNFQNISYNDIYSALSMKLTVDLSNNQISYIVFTDAEISAADKFGANWKDNPHNNPVRVVLRGNPLICDCNAFDLVNYFRDSLAPQVRSVVEFDGTDLYCAEVDDLQGQLVSTLDPRLLTCKKEPCPSNCTCYFRPADKALKVDCFDRGFTEMPPFMPNNDTMDNIESITNHTELDISKNRIEVMPVKLGAGYDRITIINMANNNLREFNGTAFSKNIQEINLDNNNITRMNSATMEMLKNSTVLKKIYLTNNPWNCDCSAITFIRFVLGIVDKVPNFKNITCNTGEPLNTINESQVCETVQYIGLVSVLIGVLGLLIGALATAYYRFQREIKVWLYAHRMCLWFVTEEELDKDKQYDAFVSYSSLDENFILEKLVPGLENGPTKYKLCLHYRDWIVGDFIPNQIARSVEESRRTIVVLSPNFLESVWGRMEFRAAHSQALSEGRARVIVILYGDIGKTENLDPELRAYLSMNTYVKWGDPWFWERLRYALPHPSELSKGMALITQPGKRQKRNEKLINGIDNNMLNPSITTPPADSIIADPLKLIDSKPI